MVLLGIVDDAQPGFIVYSGNQWTHSTRPSYYNRTVTECQAPPLGTSIPPSFSFSFYGTTVNLFGGPVASNMAFSYSVDGAVLSNAIVNFNAIGKMGAELWSLTGLSSASEHTLKIVPTSGLFSLDYITFTPTTLTTQITRNLNVIYDDSDSSALQYSGTWNHTLTTIPGGVSYEGTRSGSSINGNTMGLKFVGSSITVNGLLNQGPGSLSASFTVDGGKATTFSPFNGTQQVNTSSWAFAQPFFHEDLSPGSHSLLVTVEQATESQVLWIDSVVFGATTNTSINSTPTGNSTSSGGPGKKIIGIAAGVVALLILSAIVRMQNRIRRRRPVYHPPPRNPSPPVVEEQPQFISQATRIPIPQPQVYQPYEPYEYVPMPRQNYPYGTEMTLTVRDIYPPANHRRSPSPPPSRGYYESSVSSDQAHSARNDPPKSTYTAPRHDEDGLDFRSTTHQAEDGLELQSIVQRQQQIEDGLSDRRQGRNNAVSSSDASSNPTRSRPRAPPEQDGSDGVPLQQQRSPAPFSSNQLDGSESLTQLNDKSGTTRLTYNTTPRTSAAGPSHQDGSGSNARPTLGGENDANDEPPPYDFV